MIKTKILNNKKIKVIDVIKHIVHLKWGGLVTCYDAKQTSNFMVPKRILEKRGDASQRI